MGRIERTTELCLPGPSFMMVSSILLLRAEHLGCPQPCQPLPVPRDALLMHFWGHSLLACSPPFLCSHTFPCTQSRARNDDTLLQHTCEALSDTSLKVISFFQFFFYIILMFWKVLFSWERDKEKGSMLAVGNGDRKVCFGVQNTCILSWLRIQKSVQISDWRYNES